MSSEYTSGERELLGGGGGEEGNRAGIKVYRREKLKSRVGRATCDVAIVHTLLDDRDAMLSFSKRDKIIIR